MINDDNNKKKKTSSLIMGPIDIQNLMSSLPQITSSQIDKTEFLRNLQTPYERETNTYGQPHF